MTVTVFHRHSAILSSLQITLILKIRQLRKEATPKSNGRDTKKVPAAIHRYLDKIYFTYLFFQRPRSVHNVWDGP